jgi:CheY-like chemotaxis protein
VASGLLMSLRPEGGGFFSVDSLRGVWILVLDSDPAGLRSLTQVLEYCGALVTGVATPEQALQVMRQVRPDVLVAALSEDEQDAVGLIRRLRAFKPEDGGMIPAIAVVPSTRIGEEQMRARGFEGYLAKPVDPWRLCRLVSSITMPR